MKLTSIYMALLAVHLTHIIEELAGKASFIQWYGLTIYLFLEAAYFLFAVGTFMGLTKRSRIAYTLSYAYAAIMVMDGIFHILRATYHRTYLGNGAGSFTAIILIFLGGALFSKLLGKKQYLFTKHRR